MNKWLMLLLAMLLGLLGGFLISSGSSDMFGTYGLRKAAKQTEIYLIPGTDGRCSATIKHQKIKAKRLDFVGWDIVPDGCSLPAGGKVEIRFTDPATAPTYDTVPSDPDFIVTIVLQGAQQRSHPYKIWAVFPDRAQNYVLMDPDLEIEQ